MTFRPCAVVPSFNHARVIGDVVTCLYNAGLPVFIIDDGSAEPARSTIAALHDRGRGVSVSRIAENQGKGSAVCRGFHLATQAGFTHVLQVDADGQHDLSKLSTLLELSRQHPEALIAGRPIFDATIPVARRVGRWITHFWVWIETLSFRVADSMCGFRVYPLAAVMPLLAEETVGRRMEFDTAIMVKLFWRGVPVVSVPVRVTYPKSNLSNFDVIRDNWRITRMHTTLVVSMLVRLPLILRNRPPVLDTPASHWAQLSERGLFCGLRFCALAYRLLGRAGCLIAISPIVLYFYLTGRQQRAASRDFLTRVFIAQGERRKPGFLDGYRHFLSFAGRAVDTFAAWSGALTPDIVTLDESASVRQAADDRRGALFIVSHLGNADLSRALLDRETRNRLTVLVHTRNAVHYNEVLRRFNPDAAVNTLQVSDIGPETTIALRERIDRGAWVVIAGDRTPVENNGRVTRAPFLGEEAPFPQGPLILAALLGCPVYLLFCLREGKGYRLYVERFSDRIDLPRGCRDVALRRHLERYAGRLEHYVMKAPFQWYNFYDFWA